MYRTDSKLVFAFPTFIAFMGIVAAIMIFIGPSKTEYITDEKILIKKVKVIPDIYMRERCISIEVTTETTQCQGHNTNKLYGHFTDMYYPDLLLPMANPDKIFYLKNPKLFWDEKIQKCILTKANVKPVEEISHP